MSENYKVRFNLREILDPNSETDIILMNLKEPRIKPFLNPNQMDLVIIRNFAGEYSVGYYGEFQDVMENVKQMYSVLFGQKFSESDYRIVAGTTLLLQNQHLHANEEKDFEHIGTELYREIDEQLILRLVDIIEYPGIEVRSLLDLDSNEEETEMYDTDFYNDTDRSLNWYFVRSENFDISSALLAESFFNFVIENSLVNEEE
jgi:hypothetical protein